MKTILKIALLVAVLLSVRLDAAPKYYERLMYRFDDPFVFCTQGQDRNRNPNPCWKPVSPYTGAFIWMPHCRPPNPYGVDWTQDDWASYFTYVRVCPFAEDSGSWDGPGRPESTPFTH